jgi:hypothetical protein
LRIAVSVYDFVPDNYESLISGEVRPLGDKMVAVKGEENMREPRFEHLLG